VAVGNTAVCGQGAFVDTNYVVPSGRWTITSFSFQSAPGNKDERLDFLDIRPAGSTPTYLVVGKTGLITLAGTGLETFPANLAVLGGDILGMWVPRQSGARPELQRCAQRSTVHNSVLQNFDQISDPPVGNPIAFPYPVTADLNESANIAPR
jgi:hypothetical protein